MNDLAAIADRLRNTADSIELGYVPVGTPGWLREAAVALRTAQQWQDDAVEELVDIRGQWGDEYLWHKHNEDGVARLLAAAAGSSHEGDEHDG